MARGDLTDEEWPLIEPHLPLGERGPIPDLRQQFNAVMWRFRTGSPWLDLPAEYGPWSTVHNRFRSWATAGVFEHPMQAVIAEAAAQGQADLNLVSVDSTTARPHHHAAGMALDGELVTALEEADGQEKAAAPKGAKPPRRRRWRRGPRRTAAILPPRGGRSTGHRPRYGSDKSDS
ncbi:transposase [Microtetraspora malaysiensis]|uniref:transposase n=1 Tax=Microtetraspora malaysiensis TaxID=161358 RepID=UPI003D921AFC